MSPQTIFLSSLQPATDFPIDEEDVCTIQCYEPFASRPSVRMPCCPHFICPDCLRTWTRDHSTCPFDRTELFNESTGFVLRPPPDRSNPQATPSQPAAAVQSAQEPPPNETSESSSDSDSEEEDEPDILGALFDIDDILPNVEINVRGTVRNFGEIFVEAIAQAVQDRDPELSQEDLFRLVEAIETLRWAVGRVREALE